MRLEADKEHGKKPATSHLTSQRGTGKDRSVFCSIYTVETQREALAKITLCKEAEVRDIKVIAQKGKGGLQKGVGDEEKRL